MIKREKIAKTIRIITFNNAYSFGAVLQTFALWKFLDERYSDVKVINFFPQGFSLKAVWNRPMSWLKTFQFRFRKSIGLTKVYSKKELIQNPPFADTYIIGSDQVWNPAITKEDADIFCGSFIPKYARKISYASSFGKTELDNTEKAQLRSLLFGFDAISVREESGIQLCERICDQDAICVIDPTFLIQDYSKYVRLKSIKDELCLFVLDNNSLKCFECAKFVAAELGLKPKVVNKSKPVKGMKVIPFPTIPRFLKEIYSSKFVITNSFHGLAFSIIFQKDFIFVCTNKSNSTRPINLLNKLGLIDRLVYSYEDVYKAPSLLSQIDYTSVNILKEQYINTSKDFLTNNI